jgi:hypothetical protein
VDRRNKNNVRELEISVLESLGIELTYENVDALVSIFSDRGAAIVNGQINGLMRYLHTLKYSVIDE